jgi:hypothetical protein
MASGVCLLKLGTLGEGCAVGTEGSGSGVIDMNEHHCAKCGYWAACHRTIFLNPKSLNHFKGNTLYGGTCRCPDRAPPSADVRLGLTCGHIFPKSHNICFDLYIGECLCMTVGEKQLKYFMSTLDLYRLNT